MDEEHQQKLTVSAIQHHPLTEISHSPGHLLLLKLWQREEDLFARRIARKETRIDTIKREIFELCCFFCIFNALLLTILFTAYSEDHQHHQVCHNWWIPSVLCLCTCLVIVFLVQMKLFRYGKVRDQFQKERNDNRALIRCIQELRMKGSSFDLSKEPLNGKRMKSSSVEIKWKPVAWISQFLITICLVFLTALVFLACRLMLCA